MCEKYMRAWNGESSTWRNYFWGEMLRISSPNNSRRNQSGDTMLWINEPGYELPSDYLM